MTSNQCLHIVCVHKKGFVNHERWWNHEVGKLSYVIICNEII